MTRIEDSEVRRLASLESLNDDSQLSGEVINVKLYESSRKQKSIEQVPKVKAEQS